MPTIKQVIRWTPVAYYVAATAWDAIVGGIELDQVFVLVAAAACYFFLAQAAEWGSALNAPATA